MTASDLLARYATAVVQRRWYVLSTVLGLTLTLSVGVARVFVEVDPDRQLPQDHPYIQALKELHNLFGDKNLVVIGLHPIDRNPFSPKFLAKTKAITDALAAIPGIVRPLLQSVSTPTVKDVRATDKGIVVRPVMAEIPSTIEEGAAVRERLLHDPSHYGTLIAYDNASLAIYATFELTSELPGYVNIHRAVLNALEHADDGSFTFSLSGPVVIASSLSLYANQMVYLFPVALLVIGLVHYDAFRTIQAIIFPLLTGILAVIWALGLMGFAGIPLDPFNSTTPVLILAVAAGHAVQLLKRYYEEFAILADNHSAIIQSIARVGGVMIAAGTIATLSFLSLATFGTESMRTFGFFTGFGIASTIVIEMTTIPALRAILPMPKLTARQSDTNIHPWLDRWLAFLGRTLVVPSHARFVLISALVVVAVSTALAGRVEVDTSLKRNFSSTDQVRLDEERLNAQFAGTNQLIFLIEAPGDSSIIAPDSLRAIDDFQKGLDDLPGARKSLSIVDILKRIHQALTPRQTWDTLPSSTELAAQYLFLYSLSGGDDLNTKVTADNRITKVVLLLDDDSTSYGERTIALAQRLAMDTLPTGFRLRVSGSLASNSALTDTMVRGKLLNILQITTITVVVASVILRSCLAGMLVAVPLAIAVAINFGVMGAFGIRLDVATAVVTAMAVGIGADYAVYFLFRLREEYAVADRFELALVRALATSGKAILFVSSAVGLGYSVLCLSGFRLFVQLGAFVGLAMVTSSLATLLILPSLVTLISRTPWLVNVLGSPAPRSAYFER